MVKSPDLFLFKNHQPAVAIECKSRRMAHPAQFGPNPIEDAKSGFDEIAKGIAQLWRYTADSDSGLLPESYAANQDTLLLLLTLDNWMDAPMAIRPELFNIAHQKANQKGIPEQARKPVSFASISDFEHVTERASTNQILETIQAHSSDKYCDWQFSNVFNDLFGNIKPIEIATEEKIKRYVPWWSEFDSAK